MAFHPVHWRGALVAAIFCLLSCVNAASICCSSPYKELLPIFSNNGSVKQYCKSAYPPGKTSTSKNLSEWETFASNFCACLQRQDPVPACSGSASTTKTTTTTKTNTNTKFTTTSTTRRTTTSPIMTSSTPTRATTTTMTTSADDSDTTSAMTTSVDDSDTTSAMTTSVDDSDTTSTMMTSVDDSDSTTTTSDLSSTILATMTETTSTMSTATDTSPATKSTTSTMTTTRTTVTSSTTSTASTTPSSIPVYAKCADGSLARAPFYTAATGDKFATCPSSDYYDDDLKGSAAIGVPANQLSRRYAWCADFCAKYQGCFAASVINQHGSLSRSTCYLKGKPTRAYRNTSVDTVIKV